MKRLVCLTMLLGCSQDHRSPEYKANVARANQPAQERSMGQRCSTGKEYDADGRDEAGAWRWSSVAPLGSKMELRDQDAGKNVLFLCTLTGWAKDSMEEEQYLKAATDVLHIPVVSQGGLGKPSK